MLKITITKEVKVRENDSNPETRLIEVVPGFTEDEFLNLLIKKMKLRLIQRAKNKLQFCIPLSTLKLKEEECLEITEECFKNCIKDLKKQTLNYQG